MTLQQLLPYLVPLVVVIVLYIRTSRAKPRPVSAASLLVVPAIAIAGIGSALWFQPHADFGPGAYAILAAALIAGIGTGTVRARILTLRRCPDTGRILMETSSYAFILLAALVFLKMAFRQFAGSAGAVAVDASLLFALGMIVSQRLNIWLRLRAIP